MGIHRITVPIRNEGKGTNVLWHAAALAKRFRSHISALHCRPRPQDLLPFGVPIPAMLRDQVQDSISQVADEEEQSLRDEFQRIVLELGLDMERGDRAVPGPTASFQEAVGKQIDVIKTHGRLSDVIAVAKPDRDRNIRANTLKSAIFASGRPVLMCPPRTSPPAALGEHVAIGWNGSIEASRAVAMSMAIIRKADRVTILTAREEPNGATSKDLVEHLAMRGVESAIRRFERKGNAGRQLLVQCDELGADLLIMGAYHDSHERETLFGGNSQAVVDEAMMPVVFVH